MRTSLRLFTSRVIAMTLTGAIAVILLGGNFTLINAQQLDQPQEQQSPTNQPSANQNTTTQLFQKPDEGFRVQVPDGWIIQDVNNSGSTLEAEALEGVGILAQLCLEEGQSQQLGAAGSPSANAGGGSSSATNSTGSSCQGPQEEVIHVIRYLNIETDTQQPDDDDEEEEEEDGNVTNNNNLTTYHLQKLAENGYTNIQTINSTTTTINLILPQTNQTIAETPAKIVEMTYTTAFAPNETRRGYFLLTSTGATLPNIGTPKGYSILYEGPPLAAAGGAASTGRRRSR